MVTIGIGGSDLGPALAHPALRNHTERNLTARFVYDIDPTDFATALEATHDLDAVDEHFRTAPLEAAHLANGRGLGRSADEGRCRWDE